MESLVVLPSLSAAELLSRIKEAFTWGGVGLVLGTACVSSPASCLTLTCSCLVTSPYSVYGITVFQAYIYFRDNGQDSVHMKSFVSKPSRVQ